MGIAAAVGPSRTVATVGNVPDPRSDRPRGRRIVAAATVGAVLVTVAVRAALGALSGLGARRSSGREVVGAGAGTSPPRYYVSLGDSYAIGYQDTPSPMTKSKKLSHTTDQA